MSPKSGLLDDIVLVPHQTREPSSRRMADAPAAESPHPFRAHLGHWVRKIVTLVALGVLFGFAYDWAAPRFYRPETQARFLMGVLHGGLMPVALPSLVMGKDVPIYATNNSGRSYKLGYIAGINLCGLIFFGTTFAKPKRSNVELLKG